MSRTRKRARPQFVTSEAASEPITVSCRELVPVVRNTTLVRRGAVVGAHRMGGWGYGVVHTRPVAIVQRMENGERRIPIRNATMETVGRMWVVALLVPLVGMALAHLVQGVGRRVQRLPARQKRMIRIRKGET